MLYAMLKNKHWGKEDASWNADQDVSGKRPEKRPEKRPDKQSEIQMRAQKIVKLLSEDPSLSRPAMCEKLELTDRQVRTALDYLKSTGKIYREGSAKGGRWIVD